jgi:hypothetical protein
MKKTLLLNWFLILFAVGAAAQVPQVINYQGRVVVGSTNFNGPTGSFKFALVNTNGSTTYWSNDGTSSGGSQPTNGVSLTVTNGLYSVLLGDTSLSNMTSAIPLSVFNNSDVRLRVWFSDGTPKGFQMLAPDQRLAATGYALMAGGVNLPQTTSATNGVVLMAGVPFLHAYGEDGAQSANTFVGQYAGNNFSSTAARHNTGTGFFALANTSYGPFNTANGYEALMNVAGGSNNIGLGSSAGINLINGSNNIDIGNQGVADESNIIRIGDGSTQTDTYLTGNVHLAGTSTIIGSGSGLTGIAPTSLTWVSNDSNTAAGYQALSSSSDASSTAFGYQALSLSTSGQQNSAFGQAALYNNTTGSQNTADGWNALAFNTTANNNTATGFVAMSHNTTGNNNTALGYNSLQFNTTANQNVAIGSQVLQTQSYNNGGTNWSSNNVAVGYKALFSNQPTSTSNGIQNTAVGTLAITNNTTGGNNIAIGYNAGSNNSTGSNSIWIGNTGGNESGIIRIGDGTTQSDTFLTGIVHASGLRTTANSGINVASPITKLDVGGSGWFRGDSGALSSSAGSGVRVFYDSTLSIGNIFAYNYGISSPINLELEQNGGNVGIGTSTPNFLLTLNTDSAGKPNGGSWANTSDSRVKQNIQPMQNALERLTKLRGVTFEWRNPEDHANQHGPQAGFIAQEVESVFPKWVTEVNATEHDRPLTDNGKTKSLSLPFEFDALVVESIKQQQTEIAAKDQQIAALKQEVEELKAKEKERDARLAKLEQQIK